MLFSHISNQALLKLIIGITICSYFHFACEDKPSTRIETVSAVATGPASATVTGRIEDLSYDIQGDYGFCYATESKPNINDSKIIMGTAPSTTLEFSGEITGLTPSTKYYIRSFIEEEGKHIYGNTKSFTTEDALGATLTTTPATNIDSTSATCGGNITSDGFADITERGVCWDTLPDPTYEKNHLSSGTGTGAFSVNITGLTFATRYYARAYARNAVTLAYGNEISFNTNGPPVVTTATPYNIASTSATFGGNVTSDGGYPVTERGVCWDTLPNPTYQKNHISSGTGTGSFSVSVTGLTVNKTHYVKAYAVNIHGISYGSEVSFTTTQSIVPTVWTQGTSNIDSSQANCGGYIYNNGGWPITEKGICWSASPEPTYNDNHISSGSGSYDYSVTITGLTPLTQYYYRAYARNINGLGYGAVYTFSTISRFTDSRDGRTYRYLKIGTQYWMIDNLNYRVYDPAWTNNHSWYFNDDSVTYSSVLGRMYDWVGAIHPQTCPYGWHLPDYAELQTLRNYFGGDAEEFWNRLTIHGFWPRLAGYRDENGVYLNYPPYATTSFSGIWSASEYDSSKAYCMEYRRDYIPIPGSGTNRYTAYIFNRLKSHGIYIRCVKD